MRFPVAPVRLCLALGMIPLLFGITAPRATAVTYTKLTVYFADEQDAPILTGTFVVSADDGSFIPANTQTTSAQGYAYFDYVPVGSTITLNRQDTPPDGYETITLGTEASGPVPAEPELTFPFRYDPVAGVNRIVYLQQRVITTAPTPTPEPPTATATPSPTSTLAPTATATPTATASPTPTSTSTPTATHTPLPPTETPSPTPTLTPAPATSTPSPTSTATVTASPTQTATATATHTATPPPSTETPFPTPTPTPTETALPTQTPTATASPTATLSPPTDTPSPTSTDTPTATSTPTATLTPVLSLETATIEPSATATETPTPTMTAATIPPTATSSATADETTTPAPATATLDLAPLATATPTQGAATPTATLSIPDGGATPTIAPLIYGSVIVIYADTNGVGVSGSWFQLNAADCQAPFRPARVTDSSGSVRFERIPLGSYCLAQARPAEGYAPVSQRQIVVDREQVPVVVGATWLGATPTPLPTEEPVPDTTGVAPELEILVWRCAGLLGSRPPVFDVSAPDALEDDDGTSGIRTGGTNCVPTAADLLIYPFGSMDGTVGDPMPVHINANGRILISDGLAPTSGRSPHLLSEPLSGATATFELMPAARTRITLVLGGLAPRPDSAGPPVLTLPATGSGRYPSIGHLLFLFLSGTLLVAFLGSPTFRACRRILRSRL